MTSKILSRHLERKAIVYVRQSSAHQVLHNQESQRLQYGMRQRVQSLGWQEVEIIDDDLGQSAATAAKREGFQRMVTEICLGKVGAVAAREVSRFARNNRDWHQLIEMCSLVETVLIDHETVYDPRRPNDRLLLGLKGTLSEYELDLLRQRSLEARWAKAERGELVIHTPVGFVKSGAQGVEKDPDQRVQRMISLIFEKFFELGSARQAFMWFIEQGLQIPAQRYGLTQLETYWKRPYYGSIIRILKDPTYAGAYTYGRTTGISQVRDGVLETKRITRPLQECKVLIQEHHDGYISWNEFERIQEMLDKNASDHRFQRHSAAKKGAALLAGLLRCRRCGRKLMVSYSGREGSIPRYQCRRGKLDNGEPNCISFAGLPVDDAVSREVLRVVEPGAIEAAILAVTDEATQQSAIMEALRLELQEASYAAERARKQYDAVAPDNRLVADELERRWNLALERVSAIENRAAREQQMRSTAVEPVTKESLADLASDLQRVWNEPSTDVRLEKRIFRSLIEEIIVDIDFENSEVEIVIHWKGGIHSTIRVTRRRRGQSAAHTSPDVVDAIRVLALICKDKVIASYLNRNGILTTRGNRWVSMSITSLRNKRGIPVHSSQRQQEDGWMNLTDAAKYVGAASKTVRRAVEQAKLKGQHPLPDGPWIFNRNDLDDAIARGVFPSDPTDPAGPQSEQLSLEISMTYQDDAL